MTADDREPRALMFCKVVMRARINAAAKAVAAILLDHLNWKTGRCDPGLARIAGLSGYSRAAVQIGIDQLVGARLIRVIRHGGGSDRNRYQIDWANVRELDAAHCERLGYAPNRARQGMARRGRGGVVENDHGGVVENDHGGVVENDHQTRRSKPDEENTGVVTLPERGAAAPSKGQAGRGAFHRGQRPFLLPLAGGRGGASQGQAKARSESRYLADLIAKLPTSDARADAWAIVTEDLQSEIVAAERSAEGAGLARLAEAVRRADDVRGRGAQSLPRGG